MHPSPASPASYLASCEPLIVKRGHCETLLRPIRLLLNECATRRTTRDRESQQPFDRAFDVVLSGGLGFVFRQFVSFARRRGKYQEEV